MEKERYIVITNIYVSDSYGYWHSSTESANILSIQ